MSLQILRNESLNTLPYKKVLRSLQDTIDECKVCSQEKPRPSLDGVCERCRTVNVAKQRYAKSNIPLRYWNLEMHRDFKGDPSLLEKYNSVVKNLNTTYDNGICLCFAGLHGTGKTMVCSNILKRACEKGYSCLYITLSDIVELVTDNKMFDKTSARKELLLIDFLAIDEFDPRHMGSVNASDLFGRILENIFRSRAQNMLPLFMGTNSPNIIESFTGPIKDSIESLMNYVEIVPILGHDFRKNQKV